MRAAVYARKSTEQNVSDEALSTTRQIERARDFAASKGWTVADEHVYTDEAISGAEWIGRHAFNRLLAALSPKPPFQHLIVMELSRIGRDTVRTPFAIQQIEEAGVEIHGYLSGQRISLADESSEIQTVFGSLASSWERRRASQRTKDALLKRVKDGYAVGAAGFGYRLVADGDRKRREIDPEQAPIVRRIFDEIAEGKGFLKLAKLLNAERIPAPTSKGWSPNGLKALAHAEVYRGRIVYGQTRNAYRGGKEAKIAVPESEWIVIEQPELRIVSEDLWNAAHARLTASRDAYLRSTEGRLQSKPESKLEAQYLLSGFLKCGLCHGNLIAVENGRGYACSTAYKRGRTACAATKRYTLKSLDADILTALDQRALNFAAALEFTSKVVAVADEPERREAERQAIAADVQAIEAELARLVDVVAKGLSNAPSILSAIQGKESALAAARAKLEHAEGESRAQEWARSPKFHDKLRQVIAEHRAYLDAPEGQAFPSVAAQRAILRKAIRRIIITPGAEGAEFTIEVDLYRRIFEAQDSEVLAAAERVLAGAGVTAAPSGERAG